MHKYMRNSTRSGRGFQMLLEVLYKKRLSKGTVPRRPPHVHTFLRRRASEIAFFLGGGVGERAWCSSSPFCYIRTIPPGQVHKSGLKSGLTRLSTYVLSAFVLTPWRHWCLFVAPRGVLQVPCETALLRQGDIRRPDLRTATNALSAAFREQQERA